MSEALRNLVSQTRAWFDELEQAGWLSPEHRQALEASDPSAPADLFENASERPLVAAFFGGTGVGKSSLLNRIVGGALARVGVERPTSYEVTLYVHHAEGVARLPHGCPADQVCVEHHELESMRGVAWLDTPDIDSVEPANLELTERWLPHVDVLIYVVSPERYRDDRGWRMLLKRRHRQALLFIFNHWDQADPAQFEQFREMLREAGFPRPKLLRTIAHRTDAQDDFDELRRIFREQLDSHKVREFNRLAEKARIGELCDVVLSAAADLDRGEFRALTADWRRAWSDAAAEIESGLNWAIAELAERFATQDAGGIINLARMVKRAGTAVSNQPGAALPMDQKPIEAPLAALDATAAAVWDDWCDSKLQVAIDRVRVSAHRDGVGRWALEETLGKVAQQSGEAARTVLRDAARKAFARPGAAWRRMLHATAAFLLPVSVTAALLWVGWLVVTGFHAGARGDAPFLGSGFLVHALLLVAVAGGVPGAVMWWARPSVRSTARQALSNGVRAALEERRDAVEQALLKLEARRSELAASGKRLAGLLAKATAGPPPSRELESLWSAPGER